MQTATFRVEGMSCGGCVQSLTRALQRTPGVEVERVEIGSATVRFDPQQASREVVGAAITRAGYEATPIDAGVERTH